MGKIDPRIDVEEARRLCRQAFERAGLPAGDAAMATEQFILCDLFGIRTHGLRRLSNYVGRLQLGGMNPRPKIHIDSKLPGVAVVDGDDGVGTVVATYVLNEGIRRAKANGIAIAGCIRSNHFGANAPYGWFACEAGMICISSTSATQTMPAPGGRTAVVGNNPIGYAAPRADGRHFIFDAAMSVASRGKLRRARDLGETIPAGWGLDADGSPSTDPAAILDGMVLPVGGHKGFGIAAAAEMLSAVLFGGRHGAAIGHQFKEPDRPSGISHYFILIDPAATVGRAAFEAEMDVYCRGLHAGAPIDPKAPVRVPGEAAADRYAENLAKGLPLDPDELEKLHGLADGSLKGEVPVS